MPTVHLGHADGQVTTAVIPDSRPADTAHLDVTAPDGAWANHASGASPMWVESDDPDLAEKISDHYGCPIGRRDEGAAR